jgi:rhamnose utilization protein RhaD (predicted bifunctional aldolase and dehydrogenase)
LLALCDWLRGHGVTDVAMEGTGVYWKPVYYALEGEFELLLVNAAHVKQVPGRKTDTKDAAWLCQLLECGLLRASFVPPRPIRELRDLTRYRGTVVVIPYVMPGFDLAREVRRIWPHRAGDGTLAMVLLNHGLFTFGANSQEAYERHVALIDAAQRWLEGHTPRVREAQLPELPDVPLTDLTDLRRAISDAAGRPMIVQRHTDPVVRRFVARPDLLSLATRGPLTPEHVIRTKRTPLVGRDVAGFAAAYADYFAQHAQGDVTMLDPAPRVLLDPEVGMLTAGPSVRDAQIAADVYHHTIPVLELAEDRLGSYVALPPGRLFEVEYWELEQAKLRAAGEPPPLSGTVALVTGVPTCSP